MKIFIKTFGLLVLIFEAVYCLTVPETYYVACKPGDSQIVDEAIYTEKINALLPKDQSAEGKHLIARAIACSNSCTGDKDIVCGSDYNNYYNIAQLKCVAENGIGIRVLQLSQCPEHKNLKPLTGDDQKSCISKCPSRQESSHPICGTDNVTYDNRDKMFCAVLCGVDTQFKTASAC